MTNLNSPRLYLLVGGAALIVAAVIAGLAVAGGNGGVTLAENTIPTVAAPNETEIAWLTPIALRVAKAQGEQSPTNAIAVATTRETINSLARAEVPGTERVLVVRLEGEFVIHGVGPAPGHDVTGRQLVLAFDPATHEMLDLFMGDFPMKVDQLGPTRSLAI